MQYFRLILFVFFLVLSHSAKAYKISVEISNYNNDTLFLGYYYGENQYLTDTAVCKDRDKFVFKKSEELEPGMYLLVMRPKNEFVQFIVPEKSQKINLKFDFSDPFNTLSTSNSKENEVFLNYLSFLQHSRLNAELLKKKIDQEGTSEEDKLALTKEIEQIDQGVKDEQKRIIAEHEETFAALIIRTNEEVEMPIFEGSPEEIENKKYRHYVEHYFDGTDFADDRLSYSSFLMPRVIRYIDTYIPQVPDSINAALDKILTAAEGSKHNFKLLLVHHLNKYAGSKFVGMDAVYVHLVDNYYATGKATWVSDEGLLKMIKNANTLRPLLIGEVAPNLTLYKKDKTPVTLHDIESKYIMLLFWAPDCGHCKKSLPVLKEMYPELQARGVEVVAVCSKLLGKEKTCWEFLEENELDLWINVTDQFLKSRFKQIYDVVKTPQLYLLDKDKVILTKKIGVEQIPKILDTIEKITVE